jgi:putative ABC transport system substrate-binding protein
MRTRREWLIALGAGAVAAPWPSLAQQRPVNVYRVGFLGATSIVGAQSRVDAVRAGLRDLGYLEGKNLVIEFRWAEGMYDRLPSLAAELVGLKVDVIVTGGTPGTRAAKEATTTIPIVMAVSGDAVATGLIASLARPGGNITGTTYFDPELHAKRLELLKETVPRATRLGVLINPDNPQTMGTTLQYIRVAAESLRLKLSIFEARSPNEFEHIFSAMVESRIDAMAMADDAMFLANLRAIADVAAKKRLPSTGAKEFAEAGGLIGYGVNFDQTYYRAAYFVDRILKGSKPGDLPVEQPPRFELVINKKTATVLGLTIPQSLLQRADKLVQS